LSFAKLTRSPISCSLPHHSSATKLLSASGAAVGVTDVNVTTQPLGSSVTGVPVVQVGDARVLVVRKPIGVLVLVTVEKVSIGSLILVPDDRVPIALLALTSPAIEDGVATGLLSV
jgi:hypothetical protein